MCRNKALIQHPWRRIHTWFNILLASLIEFVQSSRISRLPVADPSLPGIMHAMFNMTQNHSMVYPMVSRHTL